MAFIVDENTVFHTLKIQKPELKKQLSDSLVEQGCDWIEYDPKEDYFLVFPIGIDDGIVSIFHTPGYDLYSMGPDHDMYPILDSMVGKELSWDECPEEVKLEYLDGDFNLLPLNDMLVLRIV